MTRRQGSLFPDMPPTKKYVADFPELVAEWHPSKNGSKLPEDTNYGSGIKLWWLCSEGHEWQASPNTRTNLKSGCPYCAAIRVGHARSLAHSGYNLTTVNPELCKEWHSKNKRAAATYLPKSSAKVWWRCRKNPEHEWQAVIGSRTSLEGKTLIGCPFCAGKRPSKKHNLLIKSPSLAEQWHPERNTKKPEHFTPSSHKKVWWLCEKGHEWEATIKNRVAGRGCPRCTKQSSSHEIRILAELRGAGFDVESRWKIKSHELDIYLPEFSLGIEYDGAYWHKNKKHQDLKKQEAIELEGLKLVRVRELPLKKISEDDLLTSPNKELTKEEMDALFLIIAPTDRRVLEYRKREDFIGDDLYRIYMDYFPSPFPENSLAKRNPHLASEWHPTKNIPLTPMNFTANSAHKVWWICHKGHEFQARIDSRNRKSGGSGCPYCSPTYKKASPENNLTTTHPSLLAFFHPTRNEDVRPDQITAGAIKDIWWRCPNDESHEFKRSPNHMSSSKASELCPYCAGTYVSSANCMATTNPELAKFFHPMRNGSNTVFNTRATDRRSFWWVCPSGHEWEKSASAMVRRKGSLCFTCRKAMTKL